MVGRAWPTFSVAGMKLSGVILRNRSQAVVGAKEPMPRVSKKLATAPRMTDSGPGAPVPRFSAARPSTTMKAVASRARAVSRIVRTKVIPPCRSMPN